MKKKRISLWIYYLFLFSVFSLLSGCLSNMDDYFGVKKNPSIIYKVSTLDTLEDGNTECQNELDDDGDKLADCQDPGCLTTAACLDSLPEDSYTKCQNGLDDDGDWLIDCKDPQCQMTDACKGEIMEDAQSLCQNGLDDDVDGLIDCQDPGCLVTKACMDKQPEDSYTLCMNGKDDDGNGLVDCKDNLCLLTQACGEIIENTSNLCTDKIDNDKKDGIDCADPKCASFSNCQEKTNASCSDMQDNDRDGQIDCKDSDCASMLACMGVGENTAALCANGKDDDADGSIDCSDADCKGLLSCLGESTEALCQNKIDDDKNGSIDCSDLSCAVFSVCNTSNTENQYNQCVDKIDNDKDGLIDCLDNSCSATEACKPETVCNDNFDNDLDGSKDCDDLDCKANPICIPERSCTDQVDNDGDKKVDCQDPDCYIAPTVCKGGEGFPGAWGNKRIKIVNNCLFPIYSHVVAKYAPTGSSIQSYNPVGGGTAKKLLRNDTLVYDNVPDLKDGRIYAYYKDPGTATKIDGPLNEYYQSVQMHFDFGIHYNLDYSDQMVLPAAVRGDDGRCAESRCNEVFYRYEKWLVDICPHPLDHLAAVPGVPGYPQIGRCTGSYKYCTEVPSRNLTDPYCTKMAAYSGKYKGITFTGADVYGGTVNVSSADTGFWDQLTAWNQGSATDVKELYNQYLPGYSPYNDYAKMVHKDFGCQVKSFATDTAGMLEHCPESLTLITTWCPDE